MARHILWNTPYAKTYIECWENYTDSRKQLTATVNYGFHPHKLTIIWKT